MKFNFPLVVFDLETTDDADHVVIEIGAVALDKDLRPVGERFKQLVRPDRPLSPRVIELTGHTDMALWSADWLPAAAANFEAWALRATGVSRLQKLRLAAWGNYFDVNVLRTDYARHGLEFHFSGTVIDVKTVALLWHALSGRRTDAVSVASTAQQMGLVPIGDYHRADVDAEMTAQILRRAVSDIEGGVWVGKQYVAVRPEVV